MDSLQVIKKLGKGAMGTTYLVEIHKKHYICKIEKISEKDIVHDLRVNFWREIEFAQFAKQYSDYFMTLLSYEILLNCKHKQPIPKIFKSDESMNNKNNSKYCTKLIYSPVLDGTLRQFNKKIGNVKTKEFYSMFCQIIYSLKLLSDNNWYHNDVHSGNIMFKHTSKKTIKIDGDIVIPTFGLKWFLIDYGFISHVNFPVNNEYEKNIFKNKYFDSINFIISTLNLSVWKIIKKHDIEFDYDFNKLHEKIQKSPNYKSLTKYLPAKTIGKQSITNIIFYLHLLWYPLEHHSFMNIDVNKYKKEIMVYTNDYKMFYSYMFKNIEKPMEIIKYVLTNYLL